MPVLAATNVGARQSVFLFLSGRFQKFKDLETHFAPFATLLLTQKAF